ncbi:Mg2+ transporter protein [Haematococcus lacustris]
MDRSQQGSPAAWSPRPSLYAMDEPSNVAVDIHEDTNPSSRRSLLARDAGHLEELKMAAEEEGYEHYEDDPGHAGTDQQPEDTHSRPTDTAVSSEPGSRLQVKPMRSKKRGDKKNAAAFMKSWLRIEATGSSRVLHADKYKLTQKLGIQTRDLRLLDPHMATTYPSAILCRDKSIVVNLEHIKAIITTDSVLVVNHEEDSTTKFIAELKQRLAHPGLAGSKSFASMGDLQRAAAAAAPPMMLAGNGAPGVMPGNITGLSAMLPFELRALEVCLDEVASEFDMLTTELEASAYPALDALATKVTSPHLECVRRIKNRLVRLTTRVQTVREVVEKFLDDDEDMHDLNLTANLERERERQVSALDLDLPLGGAEPGAYAASAADSSSQQDPNLGKLSIKSMVSSLSTNSSIVENEVAEVEMLLEAYFMHFDNTYNRLQNLNEYIKDTEDMVNIKLDQHRNQLITTDLILTAFTCAMAMVTTIAGIFGMNLDSGLQEVEGVFVQVTVASCVGAVGMFALFVIWAWRYGLLVFA